MWSGCGLDVYTLTYSGCVVWASLGHVYRPGNVLECNSLQSAHVSLNLKSLIYIALTDYSDQTNEDH